MYYVVCFYACLWRGMENLSQKESDVAVVLQSAVEPKLAKLGINDFLHD